MMFLLSMVLLVAGANAAQRMAHAHNNVASSAAYGEITLLEGSSVQELAGCTLKIRLIKKLGAGFYGETFNAKLTVTGPEGSKKSSVVAVKVEHFGEHRQKCLSLEELKKKYENSPPDECEKMMEFKHPAFPKCIAWGYSKRTEANGVIHYQRYIVMTRCQGNTLQTVINGCCYKPTEGTDGDGKCTNIIFDREHAMTYGEKLPPHDFIPEKLSTMDKKTCVNVFYKLLQTIVYLWEKDYTHRDLKMDNILSNNDFSELSPVDFGIAKKITSVNDLYADLGRMKSLLDNLGLLQLPANWNVRKNDQGYSEYYKTGTELDEFKQDPNINGRARSVYLFRIPHKKVEGVYNYLRKLYQVRHSGGVKQSLAEGGVKLAEVIKTMKNFVFKETAGIRHCTVCDAQVHEVPDKLTICAECFPERHDLFYKPKPKDDEKTEPEPTNGGAGKRLGRRLAKAQGIQFCEGL